MNIPTSLLLDGKVYIPEAEFNELQAMLAAANKDRDTALSIARGYHDQWTEADRERDTAYAKGLEDAARIVDDAFLGKEITDKIAEAIRALSRLPVPSEGGAPHEAAAAQSPDYTTVRVEEWPWRVIALGPQDPTSEP